MNQAVERLVKIAQESMDLICECKNEKSVQDVLAAQLKCKVRQVMSSDVYPNAEIDLCNGEMSVEVKFNAPYYAGIGQIFLQKYLHHKTNLVLFHVNESIDEKFETAIRDLSYSGGFTSILINLREKTIKVFENV